MPEGKGKFNYTPWVKAVPKSEDFPEKYRFHLIEDLDELRNVLSSNDSMMGFDTETTGLNHEEIFVVGYSFCMNSVDAYYVPVNHKTFGLGDEALDLIYDKMCRTPIVFMFNMRYDVRVMEWHGFKALMDRIDNSGFDEKKKIEAKKQLLARQLTSKYDMSNVNTIDVQAIIFDIDTGVKYPSLKKSETYYLGWTGDSFEDTVGDAGNFYELTPEKAYFYAATDALGTLLLGKKLMPFLKQAKKSGELDVKCLQPLVRFENELTEIDTEKLKTYSDYLTEKIRGCQERCWTMNGGKEFNLGSPVDNNKVLTKLNIHTGVTTTRGMSTSKAAIKKCLESLSKDDPARQLLEDLVNYASYTKQKSSYVDNVIELCKQAKNHPNRIRFSYKTTEVPSGRFAAGGDKKNQFFSTLNIQNITKPKMTNHYAVPFETIKETYPNVYQKILDSGTREECDDTFVYSDEQIREVKQYVGENKVQDFIDELSGKEVTRHAYKLLDWAFSDKPWLIPGIEEGVAEAFDGKLNIRAAFLPDPGYYWVSMDFNAEELRIPTLITKEPVWLDAFSHGKDIHKTTAIAIWGEENYSKARRKIAKSANFGILYGQTGRNFAEAFGMTLDEGNQFVEDFKASLPVLFRWVRTWEKVGERQGFVTTLFGRPIRVKSYFEADEWKWKSYAKRLCVNGTIQGTGADIMKYMLIKLFDRFYKTGRTNEIRFKNMIHDEINYQMRKDILFDLLPEVMDIMRIQLPDWEFPMEVGLEIGNRWGQSVSFKFKLDKEDKTQGPYGTLKEVKPGIDPIHKDFICSTFGISPEEKVEEEEEIVEEKVNFDWQNNATTWEEEKYE